MNEGVRIPAGDSTNLDLRLPGPNSLWTVARSFKIDLATVLESTFSQLEVGTGKTLADYTRVVANGAFSIKNIRNEEFQQRCVVVLLRVADPAVRYEIGELTAMGGPGDEIFRVMDDSLEKLDPETIIALKSHYSNETVDIHLLDENAQRIEQIYLVIKHILWAATKTFMEDLGYRNFIRVDGSDSEPMINELGGNEVIFGRLLRYNGVHPDFLAGLEPLLRLIALEGSMTTPTGSVSEQIDIP